MAEASKLIAENCAVRTCGPAGETEPCHNTRFTRTPQGSITPFGFPVEPDVYITYAGWSW